MSCFESIGYPRSIFSFKFRKESKTNEMDRTKGIRDSSVRKVDELNFDNNQFVVVLIHRSPLRSH